MPTPDEVFYLMLWIAVNELLRSLLGLVALVYVLRLMLSLVNSYYSRR